MTTYLALLRGINVGGHKPVAMADVCDLLARLGCVEPRSLLASGNLVFRSASRTAAQLERSLEREVEKHLAIRSDVFVRTAAEWTALVAHNPFTAEARRDPAHLVAMLLNGAPNDQSVKALQAAITGPEVVRVRGREAYIFYPNGMGRSRVTNVFIEKKLELRGTGRNWNTVLKLEALSACYHSRQ